MARKKTSTGTTTLNDVAATSTPQSEDAGKIKGLRSVRYIVVGTAKDSGRLEVLANVSSLGRATTWVGESGIRSLSTHENITLWKGKPIVTF